jgi:hypothetical protein
MNRCAHVKTNQANNSRQRQDKEKGKGKSEGKKGKDNKES